MGRYQCAVTRAVDVLLGLEGLQGLQDLGPDLGERLHPVSDAVCNDGWHPTRRHDLPHDLHVPGEGERGGGWSKQGASGAGGGGGGGGEVVNASVLRQWTLDLSAALERFGAEDAAGPSRTGFLSASGCVTRFPSLDAFAACGLVVGAGSQGGSECGADSRRAWHGRGGWGGWGGWQAGALGAPTVLYAFLCAAHQACARYMCPAASALKEARSSPARCLHRCIERRVF